MPVGRTNQARLTPELQNILGAELRWAFSSWAFRVPLPLLRLASQTIDPPEARAESYPSDEPFAWCEKGVIDGAAAAIFERAFDDAWIELHDLDVNASREKLARCLTLLMATECDSSRLKTKAILKLSRALSVE